MVDEGIFQISRFAQVEIPIVNSVKSAISGGFHLQRTMPTNAGSGWRCQSALSGIHSFRLLQGENKKIKKFSKYPSSIVDHPHRCVPSFQRTFFSKESSLFLRFHKQVSKLSIGARNPLFSFSDANLWLKCAVLLRSRKNFQEKSFFSKKIAEIAFAPAPYT